MRLAFGTDQTGGGPAACVTAVPRPPGPTTRPLDVKQVAPWAEAAELEDDDSAEMLADVALFEPNQRGRRAFDRFLTEKGERLNAANRALAERMAGAWFSIFRAAA